MYSEGFRGTSRRRTSILLMRSCQTTQMVVFGGVESSEDSNQLIQIALRIDPPRSQQFYTKFQWNLIHLGGNNSTAALYDICIHTHSVSSARIYGKRAHDQPLAKYISYWILSQVWPTEPPCAVRISADRMRSFKKHHDCGRVTHLGPSLSLTRCTGEKRVCERYVGARRLRWPIAEVGFQSMSSAFGRYLYSWRWFNNVACVLSYIYAIHICL